MAQTVGYCTLLPSITISQLAAGHVPTYSRDMRDRSKQVAAEKQPRGAAQPTPGRGEGLMSSIWMSGVLALVMVGTCAAKEPLPDAPSAVAAENASAFISEAAVSVPAARMAETKTVDAKFLSLAVISTGSAFADSYTTLFARENWLAGKKGVCNMEVESAYLYGTHPTVGRTYAVASAKSVLSIYTAYYMRKHHSKFWSLPLVANSAMSLQGVTQNMMVCN
jgi:hypothetical protein